MKPEDCQYTPFYCEENIWHLCRQLNNPNAQVIFISNPAREFVIFHQRLDPAGIIWDYHVVLLADNQVYDLDTILLFPCPQETYLQMSFPDGIPSDLEPQLRLIPASEYVESFASDRSHMLDEDGNYLHPPPPWPAIQPEQGNKVWEFADMTVETIGTVHTLDSLRHQG